MDFYYIEHWTPPMLFFLVVLRSTFMTTTIAYNLLIVWISWWTCRRWINGRCTICL